MNIPGLVLHPSTSAQLDTFMAAPAHAALLGGPAGIGKTHIAQALAAGLLASPSLENHAYYREIVPLNGTIGIEQVRELIGFFKLRVPGQAKIKRAAVLQDADSMGLEAQNALLKLLEEPPADSVLILTSSRPERLLPTIRSRVQHLHVSSPGTQDLQKHFAAAGHESAAVSAALLRSGTNVAEAERLLGANPGATDTSIGLVRQVLGGASYDRLLLVDTLSKQKDEVRAFVDTLAVVAMASLEAAARKGSASVGRWQDVLQAAHTAQDAFERNGNAKLVLTELMLAL